MTTIDCPHQEEAVRACVGCRAPVGGEHLNQEDAERSCNGEVTGHVYADSEGDSSVINGTHVFWAVEDIETSCGCVLSDDEMDKARDALVEAEQ